MMKILFVLSAVLAVGYCNSPDLYFGTLDPLQYRDSVARLNSLIACLLRITPCQGLDVNIQIRSFEIVATSCAFCDKNEKAVIHDLVSLIAQKHLKILKAIIRRYDSRFAYSKSFIRAVNTFPSKLNIANIPDIYKK